MRKAFKLQDLDCANCAAKMENGIKNIDGVRSATVSFMTQKLVLEADDDRFDAVLDEAERVCRKIDARLHHPALSDQPPPLRKTKRAAGHASTRRTKISEPTIEGSPET